MHYQGRTSSRREESFFFIDRESVREREVSFSPEESSHLVKSLRAGVGDEVIASDGLGSLFDITICSIGQVVHGEIAGVRKVEPEPCVVVLAVGLSRNDCMKWIVEKATELGAAVIVPLLTNKSLLIKSEGQKRTFAERMRRVAISALKQSKRAYLPRIEEPVLFTRFLSTRDQEHVSIILDERSEDGTISDVLAANRSSYYTIAVGPEGGFDESERISATQSGFLPARLGSARLRVETACIVALTAVRSSNNWW